MSSMSGAGGGGGQQQEAVGTKSIQFTPQQVTEQKVHHQFQSISSNPAYANKSHEELRWEDVVQGVNGGAATSTRYRVSDGGAAAAAPSLAA
jgi:hypothetical protein